MTVARNRTAVYPGTFDPITNGHIDLVNRAAPLFERLVVGVAYSPTKGPALPLDLRVGLAHRRSWGQVGGIARSRRGGCPPGLKRGERCDRQLAAGQLAGVGVDDAVGERAAEPRLRLDEDAAKLARRELAALLEGLE